LKQATSSRIGRRVRPIIGPTCRSPGL